MRATLHSLSEDGNVGEDPIDKVILKRVAKPSDDD